MYFYFVINFSWCLIGKKYKSNKLLKNKRILITGATSGIGLELSKQLANRGANLVIACRDFDKGQLLKSSLIKSTNNQNIEVEVVDFAYLKSVQLFCEKQLKLNLPIDILINNAGIFFHPPQNTKDNIEITFQTNYLSHFLLTVRLLPLLRKSPDSRIINITSKAHILIDRCPQKEFHQQFEDSRENRWEAYEYSKFCLTSFAYKLSDLLSSSTNISVHCVDPGNTETNLLRHFYKYSNNFLLNILKPLRLLVAKTPNEGIQGILYAILSQKKPGFYIEGIKDTTYYNQLILNHLLADILWTISRNLSSE